MGGWLAKLAVWVGLKTLSTFPLIPLISAKTTSRVCLTAERGGEAANEQNGFCLSFWPQSSPVDALRASSQAEYLRKPVFC